MAFSGFVQNQNSNIQDVTSGADLLVNANGSIDVNLLNSSVEISNDAGNPVPVSGTVTITDGSGPLTVDGTVNIGTMPEVEIKNDSGNPIPISGTVASAPSLSQPLGYQQISVGNTAVGLTVPVGAQHCVIQHNGPGGTRWRDDGVDPTASVGMWINAGLTFTYDGDLSALKFIRASGSNNELNISYYEYV